MYGWGMLICASCKEAFERPGKRGVPATYCRPCLRQRKRDQTNRWHKENPEKARRAKKRKPPLTELSCIDCGVRFPRQGTNGPTRTRCPECKALHIRQRQSRSVRRKRLALYGLSEEAYASIMAAQGGTCAICRSGDWSPHGPQIDHCHQSGKVRGLLCMPCNQAIGQLQDDPKIIMAAAQYVLRAQEDEANFDSGARLGLS